MLLLKSPEKSFSTATGVYTQNPRSGWVVSVMGMLQQQLFGNTANSLAFIDLGMLPP
jgi:hypothetical protein